MRRWMLLQCTDKGNRPSEGATRNVNTPEASAPRLALDGVRVVDFSHLMPGPWCTQTLGDLGADVIKVENKGAGDPSRFNPPFYRDGSVYFHSVNRNKRAIRLDLNDPDDRIIADALVERADILVESFRPGVARKLRIDYASASAANPRLIYCSLNGFGSHGSLATTPGHDAAIQGVAGLLFDAAVDVPAMPKIQTGDWAGAAYATIAILAAYVRRQAIGHGALIEVPMYDALMGWSSIRLSSALSKLAGGSGEPALEAFGANPRYANYATRDGKAVTVSLLEARSWARFCAHIGRDDLAYDETPSDRHTVHPGRTSDFREIIARYCFEHDRDELTAAMAKLGIAISPVYTPDEAVASPIANAREVIGFMEHPTEGPIPYVVDPLIRSGLSDPRRMPAPAVGEHDAEIKAEVAAWLEMRASERASEA